MRRIPTYRTGLLLKLETFSAPSKHRYAPPTIRSGGIAQGAKAESSSAAGNRLTFAAQELPELRFEGSGEWIVQDPLRARLITHLRGRLNTNGQPVEIERYNAFNAELNEKYGWASDCMFVTEPEIGAVDPDGPSGGKLRAGDVLVAVDGWMITTRAGWMVPAAVMSIGKIFGRCSAAMITAL